jgi:hypothetical protein
MIARLPTTRLERWRSSALWLCLSLFVVRVIGQIEVVVVSPHWLPPFRAWDPGSFPTLCCCPFKLC